MRYDAILLDLSLGESDGISLLQAVRDSVSDPVVVIVSGLEDRVRTASFRLAEGLGAARRRAVAQAGDAGGPAPHPR